MKKILKKENGIGSTDALIAILIITLFTGLIATLLYNIYISNTSIKRMSKANMYVIDILEYAEKIYYSDLDNTNNLLDHFTYLETSQDLEEPEDENLERMWSVEGSPESGYNVRVVLDKYVPDNDSLDLVRKITVNINYKVGSKEQNIEVYNIKSREKLTTPNKPDLRLINLEQNEKVYCVKYKNSNYIICTENDREWYSYNEQDLSNSISAKAIVTEDTLEIGDTISDANYTILEWIPRYAVNNEQNIIFLYSNSNQYIEKYLIENDENYYQRLTEISNEYSVDSNFGSNTGYWNEI